MNERYYISSGAKNCFYTLRYAFEEVVHFRGEAGAVEQQVRERDYHVRNLATDAQAAVAKAKELVGQELSAGSSVDRIVRRDEVDWSVFQAGKYAGQCIHEVQAVDAGYLVWACENLANSRAYARTVELAKALVAHELEARKAAREAQAAAREQKAAAIKAACAGIIQALRDGRNGFRDSVASDLERGELPQGRALPIVLDIYAKNFGRRNSKAYEAAYQSASDLLEKLSA